MTDETLKPCPFCGGEGMFVEEHQAHWRVACSQCGVRHPHLEVRNPNPRPALITAWNTRALDAAEQRASVPNTADLAKLYDKSLILEADATGAATPGYARRAAMRALEALAAVPKHPDRNEQGLTEQGAGLELPRIINLEHRYLIKRNADGQFVGSTSNLGEGLPTGHTMVDTIGEDGLGTLDGRIGAADFLNPFNTHPASTPQGLTAPGEDETELIAKLRDVASIVDGDDFETVEAAIVALSQDRYSAGVSAALSAVEAAGGHLVAGLAMKRLAALQTTPEAKQSEEAGVQAA